MAVTSIQQIKGYTVLPVQLEPSKHVQKSYHYLYLKKHVIKNQPESQTRSLFLVNLPINSNFATIKKLFSDVAIGCIIESFESTQYEDPKSVINYDVEVDLSRLTNEELVPTEDTSNQRIPVGCGIVTFLDRSGLNLALTSIKKLVSSNNIKYPSWRISEDEATGTVRFTKSKKLNSEALSEEVSKSLQEFQQRELAAKEDLSTIKSLVDEDGFTLVVGSHRKTKNGILGSSKKAIDLEKNEAALKKMKKKEKQDFYRFQIRERKKLEMNELLNKFKEDQERVRVMKEKRRFRPY
ncbi:hypothetical protein CANARDRAFT_29428 [[Candida] arabinofermentans NRRL YB-2248]|uniref:Ribosomal RNA-processing protein 7 C-terminal domain-containing protein n=1 Tax=[Candida] arabinofermentans NRRL YB-2248 TaxID=983967 RepID=A0A1E4SWU2_9ASCO|nr:hypothetical protein CANARDRAFT_29428 [[Candida] arabinofermentans NRRL YB-2248]